MLTASRSLGYSILAPSVRCQRMIVCALGLLLLVAAGLKLVGQNVAPYAQFGFLIHPSVQLAAVEWEIVLGLWLLFGSRWWGGAWFAAVATFLVFAGVSLSLGVSGQASCGCFGQIEASPWHAFALDVAALVLLVIARPNFRRMLLLDRSQVRRGFRHALVLFIGASLVFGGVVGLVSLTFGSPDAALAHLRGERISICPRTVNVGRVEPHQRIEVSVEVVNRTDRPVRLIGGTSDCSCVTINDLPTTLAPGEARQVSVEVRLPAVHGFFHRKAMFLTDCEQARAVLFDLVGTIDRAESVP